VPWHIRASRAVACDNLHLCASNTNNCGAKESLHRRIDSSLFNFSTKYGTTQTLYLAKVHVKCMFPITILTTFFSFKSNDRETWRVILVSEADLFLSKSLRILAERFPAAS
jgi:hypothetical protein